MSDQSETVNVSLNGLLDEALDGLKPFQKWAIERNFRRNPDNREKVLNAVEMHMAKTDPQLMNLMDAPGFTASTTFSTTPAGKGELLQIILDNLPAILEAIIKLIGLFGAMLLACLVLSQSAMGQTYPAVGATDGLGSSGSAAAGYGSSGSKALGYAAYASSGSADVQSYASSGSAVAQSYGSSGSAVASYGSSGSAAAASYGSGGSAVVKVARDFRPLRSILEGRPVRSRLSAVASVASAVPAAVGSKYQVALASAQARAASRRKGHMMSIEAGYTTGVGFSTFDPTPNTCFGVGGNYAVVRGIDGWYSTKVE